MKNCASSWRRRCAPSTIKRCLVRVVRGERGECMAMTQPHEWNAMDPGASDNVLRIVKQEAERFFKLIDTPEHWEAPTASGWWHVRDIVGHLVDTTEGYLVRFEAARTGSDPGALAALPDMATTADSRAQEFRQTPRAELTARLKDAY